MAGSRKTVAFQNMNEMSTTIINSSSVDAMHEIAIDHSNNQRPATLPVESPFGPPNGENVTRTSQVLTTIGQPPSSSSPKPSPIDSFKEWSVSTYKCTKQLVNEKLGKCHRTVDVELEAEIEKLRDTQRKYSYILKLARDMTTQYGTLIQQQNSLYECLNELAVRETKAAGFMNDTDPVSTINLGVDFRQNAEMMRNVSKNGEKLIMAMKFFASNLATLTNKTIEDTIVTIRAYETARLEYDAEKNSIASLLPAQAAAASTAEKLSAARCKYERLREDVQVKMRFLDENKAKVMHKQLILFHNAFAAFASGNAAALDSTLKQFSIKATQSSFLEK